MSVGMVDIVFAIASDTTVRPHIKCISDEVRVQRNSIARWKRRQRSRGRRCSRRRHQKGMLDKRRRNRSWSAAFFARRNCWCNCGHRRRNQTNGHNRPNRHHPYSAILTTIFIKIWKFNCTTYRRNYVSDLQFLHIHRILHILPLRTSNFPNLHYPSTERYVRRNCSRRLRRCREYQPTSHTMHR